MLGIDRGNTTSFVRSTVENLYDMGLRIGPLDVWLDMMVDGIEDGNGK